MHCRYHEGIGGVLLSYASVRFATGAAADDFTSTTDGAPLGRMLEENPALHVRVTADALVFRPAVGDVLVGRVQDVGSGHVSVLVAGVFNAVLHSDELSPWYAPASDERRLAWEATPRLDEVLAAGARAVAHPPSTTGKSRRSDSRDGVAVPVASAVLSANPRRLEEGSAITFRVKKVVFTAGIVSLVGELQSDSDPASAAATEATQAGSLPKGSVAAARPAATALGDSDGSEKRKDKKARRAL